MFSSAGIAILAGLAILFIAVAMNIGRIRKMISSRRRKAQNARKQVAHRENRRHRIAQLNANPAMKKYAELMERGGYWTDSQIAYNEDPNATATCVHLKPVEHAIRLMGVVPYLFTEAWEPGAAALPHIKVDCRINETELRRRFVFSESVRYQEGYQPERHELDNPYAGLRCVACGSAIDLVHPEWPRADTKWFPAAP